MRWTSLTIVGKNTFGNFPNMTGIDTVDGFPGGRYSSSVVIDQAAKYLYIFGGFGYGRGTYTGTLTGFLQL